MYLYYEFIVYCLSFITRLQNSLWLNELNIGVNALNAVNTGKSFSTKIKLNPHDDFLIP